MARRALKSESDSRVAAMPSQAKRARQSAPAPDGVAIPLDSQHYRMLFEKMPGGVAHLRILFDEAGNPVDCVFLGANQAFETLSGFRRDDILGKKLSEMALHGRAAGVDWIQLCGETACTGKEIRFETHAELNDRWYSVTTFRPQAEHCVAVFDDITDRKRAEAHLRESEETFRTINETALDAIIMMDNEGRISLWNKAAERIFGWTEQEAIGQNLHAFLGPKRFLAAHREAFSRFKESGQGAAVGRTLELMAVRKDGTEFPIELSLAALELKGKWCAAGIVRDITDRKRAREDLLRFRLALEQSVDGIAITDLKGNLLFVNQACAAMHGYSPEEVVDQYLGIFHTPGQLEHEVKPYIDRVAKFGCAQGELGRMHKDGSEFPSWQTATVVRDSSGKAKSVIAIIRNISDKKQAEEALRKAKDDAELLTLQLKNAVAAAQHMAAEAQAGNRAKSEFLANMSHEIRTPLNGVIGMTALLLDTKLTDEQRDCAETVRISGQRLLAVINEILDFSKIEAGRMDLECIDFDLRNILDETEHLLALGVREKGLKYTSTVDPNVPFELRGDANRIQQILVNFTNNALKFTREGEVWLRVKLLSETEDSAVLRFSVFDTGVGIAAEKQDSLFEPFTQADASTTRRYGGTGLGLAISKRLVELMGGEIGFMSEESKGSLFWFSVPLQKQNAAGVRASGEGQGDRQGRVSTPSTRPAGRQRRVLVAEDNPLNRKVVLAVLQRFGYEADAAADGYEALKLLETFDYDLVLMDCQMPKMDGFEATRCIRDPDSSVLNRDVPVIAFTASAVRESQQECFDAGMNDFIAKPVEPRKLGKMLKKWLDVGPLAEGETQAGEPEPADLVFDRTGVLRRLGGDEQLAAQLVLDFLSDAGQQLDRLEHALAGNDVEETLLRAHSIKGAASTVGATHIQQIASEIQRAAQNGDLHFAVSELTALRSAIEEFRERAA